MVIGKWSKSAPKRLHVECLERRMMANGSWGSGYSPPPFVPSVNFQCGPVAYSSAGSYTLSAGPFSLNSSFTGPSVSYGRTILSISPQPGFAVQFSCGMSVLPPQFPQCTPSVTFDACRPPQARPPYSSPAFSSAANVTLGVHCG